MKLLVDLSPILFTEHTLLPDLMNTHWVHLTTVGSATGAYVYPSSLLADLYTSIRKLLIDHYLLFGESSCSINEHKMLHVPLSMKRFSVNPTVWCYGYERKIGNMIRQLNSTNKKSVEVFDFVLLLTPKDNYWQTRKPEGIYCEIQ